MSSKKPNVVLEFSLYYVGTLVVFIGLHLQDLLCAAPTESLNEMFSRISLSQVFTMPEVRFPRVACVQFFELKFRILKGCI